MPWRSRLRWPEMAHLLTLRTAPVQADAEAGAMVVLERGEGWAAPLWRHWGAPVDAGHLPPLAQTRGAASFSTDRDVPLSLAPVGGLGWFGPEVLRVRRDGVPVVLDWTGGETTEAGDRLAVRLEDPLAGVVLEQTIAVEPGGALRFAARVINTGTSALALDHLASAVLPLPADSAALLSWRGRHNAELVECVEPMPQQRWVREGRRGLTGHGGAPGVYVLGPGADFASGEVRALQLCWSGDATIAVERDDEGCWLLSAAAALRPGEVTLAPGEGWSAPDALAVFTDRGRNGAMAAFHAAVRAMVRWPGRARGEAAPPRKVHLNSWEACYFDHDADRIVGLAQAAAQIGIERFVLDDGWFRGRNDDTAGLGDWTADPVKYPQGLGPLAQAITGLGIEFGLWVEPEMINPDSDLHRAHPDWALQAEGRAQPTARNQLVLNLARGDVRDYLFDCLDRLLRDLPIGYLKWDHNRDLAPRGGAAQVAGLYELLGRLRAAHPAVEIESCAGGGGRSDAGMVPFAHRFWTSDNIDAVSRVAMQRGFLHFLPPEMMGAHVGASPAHATGRTQALDFRAAMALPGHFGVELDPRALTEADRFALTDWIAVQQEWRDVLHAGQTWLGTGPDGLVWQAQGSAQSLLLFVVRTAPPLDRRPQPLRLPFLRKAGPCKVRLLRIAGGEGGHAAPDTALAARMQREVVPLAGSWLADAGLPLPPLKAESVALFHICASD